MLFFSLFFSFFFSLKKLYKTFFVWKITPENSAQMETGTMPCNSVNCHHGNQKNKPFWNWYRRHTLSNSSIFQPPSVLRNKMPSHWEVRERNHHERFVDVHCLVNNKKICTQLTTLRLRTASFRKRNITERWSGLGCGFHPLSKTLGQYYANLAPKAPWEFCCCNKTSEKEKKKKKKACMMEFKIIL